MYKYIYVIGFTEYVMYVQES